MFLSESSGYSATGQELSRRRLTDSKAHPSVGAKRRRGEDVEHKDIESGEGEGTLSLTPYLNNHKVPPLCSRNFALAENPHSLYLP